MKAYWDILRELREDHDLTQAQVAAVIGTTQQVYYRYEKRDQRAAAASPANIMRLLQCQR